MTRASILDAELGRSRARPRPAQRNLNTDQERV